MARPRVSHSLSQAGWSLGQREISAMGNPSWVIRWELGKYVSTLGRSDHWYTTGGSRPVPELVIDRVAKSLVAPGVLYDTVRWISERYTPETVSLDNLMAKPRLSPGN